MLQCIEPYGLVYVFGGLGFTYLVIYCLSKMVAKSKDFEMEEVDVGDAYHSKGRYVTS